VKADIRLPSRRAALRDQITEAHDSGTAGTATKKDSLSAVYDRERVLRSRLNAFIHNRFALPADDYYARLDHQSLAELKSVLSDINNIFTLRICLLFANWLAEVLALSDEDAQTLKESICRTPPNANGYDVEFIQPISVIAEIKCNVPINRGHKYGAAQRDGIAKDVRALIFGKKKSKMKPEGCLKFMVLLDTPSIRKATNKLVDKMKEHRDVIVFMQPGIKPERTDKVYVVYVSGDAKQLDESRRAL
jgi:hypothetical protein